MTSFQAFGIPVAAGSPVPMLNLNSSIEPRLAGLLHDPGGVNLLVRVKKRLF
jgi:hypothetical protein